jgi:hypothetical protein
MKCTEEKFHQEQFTLKKYLRVTDNKTYPDVALYLDKFAISFFPNGEISPNLAAQSGTKNCHCDWSVCFKAAVRSLAS